MSCRIWQCVHAFLIARARLAAGTNDGYLTVWEVASRTPTRTFEVGSQVGIACFSNDGDRLAYLEFEDLKVGVSLPEVDNSDEPLVEVPKVNALSDGSSRWMTTSCSAAHLRSGGLTSNACACSTWPPAPMRSGASCSARWRCRSQVGRFARCTPGSAEVSQQREVTRRRLAECVAVGAVWRCRQPPGRRGHQRIAACDRGQRMDDRAASLLSEYREELVGSMVGAAPHCSNIRDAQTGGDSPSPAARARQVGSLQKWLGACPDAAPVADHQGLTAVQVAGALDRSSQRKRYGRRCQPPSHRSPRRW